MGRRVRVWGLWVRKNLQHVAPARLVGVRKGSRSLEGVGVAVLGVLGALVLLCGLAQRLALRTTGASYK